MVSTGIFRKSVPSVSVFKLLIYAAWLRKYSLVFKKFLVSCFWYLVSGFRILGRLVTSRHVAHHLISEFLVSGLASLPADAVRQGWARFARFWFLVSSFWFQVQGFWLKVPDSGFQVPGFLGSRFKVQKLQRYRLLHPSVSQSLSRSLSLREHHFPCRSSWWFGWFFCSGTIHRR